MTEQYTEPVKNKVRSAVLRHAVESLTSFRELSPLVTENHCLEMLKYMFHWIKNHGKVDLSAQMQPAIDYWFAFRRSRISRKDPSDLQVLILCGPSPVNDCLELIRLGVSPWNIWAVEADKHNFALAVQQLNDADFPAKIHRGSLHEFFSIVPQQFDIVYFDACGPLFGGKPPTILVLKELFVNQRLSPISALITNFAKPDEEQMNIEKWSSRLASWYAARRLQPVEIPDDEFSIRFEQYKIKEDEGFYLRHISSNFSEYYSDFITSFVSDFAATLLPWWRVFALPASQREFFAPRDSLDMLFDKKRLFESKLRPEIFDYELPRLAPESFPFLWTTLLAADLPEADSLRKLFNEGLRGVKLYDAVVAVSMIKNAIEWPDVDYRKTACSKEFFEALWKSRWFDSKGKPFYRMFCDTPMPNLLMDLCFGQLGYPYHANRERHIRMTYKARATQMLTDVFILDQARYLYDLVPSTAQMRDELPDSIQIFMRICMDAIRRHGYSPSDPFAASFLAGFSGDGFSTYEFSSRETVTID